MLFHQLLERSRAAFPGLSLLEISPGLLVEMPRPGDFGILQ
jgi:hypothetical protein